MSAELPTASAERAVAAGGKQREVIPHKEPVNQNTASLELFTLGSPPWRTFDPFLFCVHHQDAYPEGNEQMGPNASLAGRNLGQDFAGKDGWSMYHGQSIPGFPRHPHRGFETVTVMRQGFVDHSDSMGATARYGKGDVQWMTAGRGIAHSEMFPLINQDTGNQAELFQIWLNLPRKDKLVAPHFSMFWNEKIPRQSFSSPEGGEVRVTQIAGKLGEIAAPSPPPSSWASRDESELAIWTVHLSEGAHWSLPAVREGTSRTLYFFKGKTLDVAGQPVNSGQGVRVLSSTEVSLKAVAGDCELLLLQARPLAEPVVQYGPFVMNTEEEIRQAYADFQRTQFGGWTFEDEAPVHSRETGRFARHADGRIEHA